MSAVEFAPLRVERARPAGPGPRRSQPRQPVVPRLLDVLLSGSALLFLAPLLLLVFFVVRAQDGGPALFWQWRVGAKGNLFRCFKIRSMVLNAEATLAEHLSSNPTALAEWEADRKLRVDPRITAIGGFLRKSSIDELPQLFNVLRGEMSLVGPRPIVEAEIPRYGRYFSDYCKVKPGITGLWQVMGRNDVSYRRRVALDVTFVRTARPTAAYFGILARTVPAVLLRSGVY